MTNKYICYSWVKSILTLSKTKKEEEGEAGLRKLRERRGAELKRKASDPFVGTKKVFTSELVSTGYHDK